MKKIVIFDTSSGSFNMGDYIIVDSAMDELKSILKGNFRVKVGTHNPVAHFYQSNPKRKVTKYFDNADYKFLLGTSILKENMFYPWPDWNVNIFNYRFYRNTVLVGAGLEGKKEKVNFYSKYLYKNILNKNYVHSTRDEEAKIFLESLGLKAINTGCPTMWSLTKEHCACIPHNKSDKVVFTLTDYRRNEEMDQFLIDTLLDNYNEVFFWVQGSYDYEYFKGLKNTDNINVISPTFEDYKEFLINNNVDFVGTRLHAGIFALKMKRRSIIIGVDNRARDIKKSYNIPMIDRNNLKSELESKIKSDFETNINIDVDKIKKWRSQFEK